MIKYIISVNILVLLISGCGSDDNSNTDNPNFPIAPTITTLTYPQDFPFKKIITGASPGSLESLNPIVVNGLSAETAYDFSYAIVASELSVLMVNKRSSSFICDKFTVIGEQNTCTGTTAGTGILMNVVNNSQNDQQFNFNIVPSSFLPTINQGDADNPVQLNMNSDFPYQGTVASNGSSYFQINNLISGSKYLVDITNNTDDLELRTYYASKEQDVQCEIAYSYDRRCLFVSENEFATIHIDGLFAFTGASYTINITKVSDAGEFEGTWYNPLVLELLGRAVTHLANIDDYSNYYKISGLTSGRSYTIDFTSKTVGVNLEFYNPTTGSFGDNNRCNPDTRSNNWRDDGGCTLSATGADMYVKATTATDTVEGGHFIISLNSEPIAEGSQTSPVALVHDGNILRYQGQVDNSKSYYHVSGITPGESYLIRLAGDSPLGVSLSVFDGDNSFTVPASCSVSNTLYCLLSAGSSDLYFIVDGPKNPPGQQFTLNISPPPVQENLSINNLPYDGQVDNYFSQYTFTGLEPNSNYVAVLSNLVGGFTMSVWKDTSSVIECMISTLRRGGCFINSGSNGAINVSIGNIRSDINEPGGHFQISFIAAPALLSEYQAVAQPIVIPENDTMGADSQITVSNSPVLSISNITVEVIIEHQYTSEVLVHLISPNGETIALADHLSGDSYINTRFNDYADTNILKSGKIRYNRAFRPLSPLHQLNGTDANGVWTLYVADDVSTNISTSQGGILHGWGISFE